MPEVRGPERDELAAIAGRFELQGPIQAVSALGHGNVNDTYLVRIEAPREQGVVLQRLNTRVFRHPRRVMRNMQRVSDHVRRRLREEPAELQGRRWEMPRVLRVRDSGDPWLETDRGFWRAIGFVEAARCLETVEDAAQARAVGEGLGLFHSLISDLPAGELSDTLEGFHVTPAYLERYRRVRGGRATPLDGDEAACAAFVEERRSWADVLEAARDRGELSLRPIHGDPKVNNVMIDPETGRAVALIDLDTVKPGLVHYDIGDCLRSACNPHGEETEDWRAVRFEVERCEAMLRGYFAMARRFLSEADRHYVYDAIRLIAFELGLRFFTDHLEGNRYFKVRHPRHNLQRARVQFALTRSIEAQEPAIRRIVERLP